MVHFLKLNGYPFVGQRDRSAPRQTLLKKKYVVANKVFAALKALYKEHIELGSKSSIIKIVFCIALYINCCCLCITVTEYGLGYFVDVTKYEKNIDGILTAINKHAISELNVELDIKHKSTLIDKFRYDSALQTSNNSITILSGTMQMLNHNDKSPLTFTTTARMKRLQGPVFKKNGGQWQQIFVDYGKTSGFQFVNKK